MLREVSGASSYLFFSQSTIKWKSKKYHIVGTDPKFNRNIVERVTFDIPNTYIHDRPLSWHSTGTSVKCDSVKLVYSYR